MNIKLVSYIGMDQCITNGWRDSPFDYTESINNDDRGDGESCGCLPPCTETIYITQLSYLQYPSDKAAQTMETLEKKNATYVR